MIQKLLTCLGSLLGVLLLVTGALADTNSGHLLDYALKIRNTGTVEEVSDSFLKAIDAAPNPYQRLAIFTLSSEYLQEKGEWERVIALAQHLLKQGDSPSQAGPLYSLILAHVQLNQIEEASVACTKFQACPSGTNFREYAQSMRTRFPDSIHSRVADLLATIPVETGPISVARRESSWQSTVSTPNLADGDEPAAARWRGMNEPVAASLNSGVTDATNRHPACTYAVLAQMPDPPPSCYRGRPGKSLPPWQFSSMSPTLANTPGTPGTPDSPVEQPLTDDGAASRSPQNKNTRKRTKVQLGAWNGKLDGRIVSKGMSLDLGSDVSSKRETSADLGFEFALTHRDSIRVSHIDFSFSGTLNRTLTHDKKIFTPGASFQLQSSFLDLEVIRQLNSRSRTSLAFLYGGKFTDSELEMVQYVAGARQASQWDTGKWGFPYIGLSATSRWGNRLALDASFKWLAWGGNDEVNNHDIEVKLLYGGDYARTTHSAEWYAFVGFRDYRLDSAFLNESDDMSFSGPIFGLEIRF
jgi:hypothetical protein